MSQGRGAGELSIWAILQGNIYFFFSISFLYREIIYSMYLLFNLHSLTHIGVSLH